MPLVSFHNRDLDKDPFTIGEFIDILSEFDSNHELRFIGMSGELFFNRFKQRGANLTTIEFDDPGYIQQHTLPDNKQ